MIAEILMAAWAAIGTYIKTHMENMEKNYRGILIINVNVHDYF